MVLFIGHCILLNDLWITLTNIPVDLVDLSLDQSSRMLSTQHLSMQILWQDKYTMQPLYNTVVKTTFIKVFQRKFKSYLIKRKQKTLPRFIHLREIGLI
jgi:hypothetical protein